MKTGEEHLNILHIEFNLGMGIYSELILLLILYASWSQGKGSHEWSPGKKYFVALVSTNAIQVLVDFFGRIDGATGFWFYVSYIANMLLFLIDPVIIVFCCLYICSQIDMSTIEVGRTKILYGITIIINTILVGLTPLYHLIFYFDAQGVYHRGRWDEVPYVALAVLAFYTEYLLIKHRRNIEKSHFLFLALFSIISITASIVQSQVYGYAFALNANTYAILIVFIYIQNRNLDTDYLTGLYNRRKLDNHIQNKIESSTATHTFAALLVDINHFKTINDTLGHQAGDVALVEAANLLRWVLRIDTFIARYGGDEFCAVFEIDSNENLIEIMERIRTETTIFNQKKDKAFQLSFSMGGDVYSKASHMTAIEFLSHIDAIMYEDKRRYATTNGSNAGIYAFKDRRETNL